MARRTAGRRECDRRASFAGRWTAVASDTIVSDERDAAVETQALALLRRYGIVYRRLLTRETERGDMA